MARTERILYMLVDRDDPYELPKFVGTMSELVEYTGKSRNVIQSCITNSRKRGFKCQYVRVKLED